MMMGDDGADFLFCFFLGGDDYIRTVMGVVLNTRMRCGIYHTCLHSSLKIWKLQCCCPLLVFFPCWGVLVIDQSTSLDVDRRSSRYCGKCRLRDDHMHWR